MQLPTGNCTSCSEPLVSYIPSDHPSSSSSSPGTPVIDDVTLPCNHHYHYACLEEEYLLSPPLPNCPSCTAPIHTNSRLVVTLHTEGGIVHNHDLTEAFEEEAFFDANPELKLQRAFMGFCAEGDVEAVKGMLEAEGGVVGEARDDEGGAVHVAILAGQWEVVKVLLEMGVGVEVRDQWGRGWREVAVMQLGEERVGGFERELAARRGF